jgi:hypothetical protein
MSIHTRVPSNGAIIENQESAHVNQETKEKQMGQRKVEGQTGFEKKQSGHEEEKQ